MAHNSESKYRSTRSHLASGWYKTPQTHPGHTTLAGRNRCTPLTPAIGSALRGCHRHWADYCRTCPDEDRMESDGPHCVSIDQVGRRGSGGIGALRVCWRDVRLLGLHPSVRPCLLNFPALLYHRFPSLSNSAVSSQSRTCQKDYSSDYSFTMLRGLGGTLVHGRSGTQITAGSNPTRPSSPPE